MNIDTGSFVRCVKHPSQFFLGFCSTCLVERLANVDSVERTGNPFCSVGNESVVEIFESVPNSHRKNGSARVRKTLLSLFKLEDLMESEEMGQSSVKHKAHCGESFEICQFGVNFELEGKGLGDRAGESGCACSSRKSNPSEGDNWKDHSISLWLYSKIPMKGLKWRNRSSSMKSKMTGNGSTFLEDKPNFRTTWNWADSNDSSKVSWEKPRHSWDGSMMSKALACSFSCLEEKKDGSGKFEETSSGQAATHDLQRSSGANNIGKDNSGNLAGHSFLLPDRSFRDLSRESYSAQPCQDIAVSEVCRRKSNGWSRVWDWNLTSPFRDFAKKNSHVLERSLSESWRENHNDNNASNIYPGSEVHRSRTPPSSDHVNWSLRRDFMAATANRQGYKADWQNMREFRLSRSHSVRYSSSRNLENGLLRFYLTPLRTSRRSVVRGRRRASHSLGFLGL